MIDIIATEVLTEKTKRRSSHPSVAIHLENHYLRYAFETGGTTECFWCRNSI